MQEGRVYAGEGCRNASEIESSVQTEVREHAMTRLTSDLHIKLVGMVIVKWQEILFEIGFSTWSWRRRMLPQPCGTGGGVQEFRYLYRRIFGDDCSRPLSSSSTRGPKSQRKKQQGVKQLSSGYRIDGQDTNVRKPLT